MGSIFWPKGGLPGILHHFTETLVTFEFTAHNAHKPHSLLFVGGLGDGLATTSYLSSLATALEPTSWSLFALTLTSSYQAWGIGHLDRDTDEIAACVRYVQEYKKNKYGHGKMVVMGHSTGSQDVLHYLHKPNPHTAMHKFDPDLQHVVRPAIDGAIMQAPVSDREAIHLVLKHGFLGRTPQQLKAVYDRLESMAKEADLQNQACDTILPIWMTSQLGYQNTPLSARRFLSLVSPGTPSNPSDDDVFSHDLDDDQLAKTFGMIKKRKLLNGRLLVLYSGADQSVPSWVDKEYLMRRWRVATELDGEGEIWDREFSGVIPNASHALSNDDQAEPRKDLVRRVMGYLDKL